MGYAIAGYPTRRRRGERHKVKLLNHGRDGGGDDENKRRKQAKRGYAGRVSVGDLPVEVIQKIFTMSGNASMYELNKFFHLILVPSASLLSCMIWENYVWDPLESGIELDEGRQVSGGNLLMIDSVFDVQAIWDYLTVNLEIVTLITRFIPVVVLQDFMEDGNSDRIVGWWNEDAPMDFPAVFYKRFEPFIYNRDFIRTLSRFFVLKDPYTYLKDLIRWFFTFGQDDNEDMLFGSIELVLAVANVENGGIYSSEPLESLLKVLFVENKSVRSIQILHRFLSQFYSRENAQEHLSDASLWRLLRSTSNMTVIDIVVNHGGQPHYGAFF